MNIDSLTFSQENFLNIKHQLITLRKQNASLKQTIHQLQNKTKILENNFNQNKDLISSKTFQQQQDFKVLLSKSEQQLLKAGNDNFLKDNLIQEQQQEIQKLRAQVSGLKQQLNQLQNSGKKENTQNIQPKSKIQEFLMTKQIMQLPHQNLQINDSDLSKKQQNCTKKRKLLRKNRIDVDLNELNLQETSDEFTNV